MSKRITEEEAVDFLLTHDHYLIFTHNSPDADTVGSACALVHALRRLGKQAIAFNREGVPKRLSFLHPENAFTEVLPDVTAHTLLSLDVAAPSMLSVADRALTFALSVDHHESNSVQTELLYLQDHYPATGEILFELLQKMNIPFDEEIATALYAAISSDSGGFRFSYTRPETMRAAAVLMETGIDFAKINRLLFESKTPTQIAVEKLGYKKLELHYDGKFALITVTPRELKAIGACEGDTECINQLPRQIAGVLCSAVIKPKGNIVKCSLRSNEDINVSDLAGAFGGGGHYHAAGFSVPDGDMDEVRKKLIEKVGEVLS